MKTKTTKIRKTTIKSLAGALLAVTLVLIGQGARAEEGGPQIYYKDGVHIDSADGNYTLQLQGRFAARFTATRNQAAASSDSFTIPRGEIRMEGNVLTKKLKYGFEMNLATRAASSTATVCSSSGAATGICPGGAATVVTTPTTTGLATLNDFYLDYQHNDTFGIKFGQFKVPFLMQQLTSATRQQFVDRSLGTGFFDLGRDIGASFHGDILNYHANYHVFVMNGDGANTLNANKGLLLGGRIEVPILGQYKPVESDVDYSESPNLGLGVAYAYNQRVAALGTGGTSVPANVKASLGTLDIGYKWHGLSIQAAAMITRTHSRTVANVTNWGYNGQVGYFLIPKHLELAARTSAGIFSGATANQHEYAGGVNYFFKGHSIKWQTDYALLRNTRGAAAGFVNDHRIRTQVQVVF